MAHQFAGRQRRACHCLAERMHVRFCCLGEWIKTDVEPPEVAQQAGGAQVLAIALLSLSLVVSELGGEIGFVRRTDPTMPD